MCAAVVAMALLSAIHALRFFQTRTSDDAFIIYRYARHLAAGHGLVWNLGEPPVEGFTSLLTVLLVAAALRLGIEPLVVGQLLGIGGAILACLCTAWLAHELTDGDGRAAVLTAAGVALTPAMAAWARGGMETTLFAAWIAGSLACWLHEAKRGSGRVRTSVLLFLAALTRPEALLVVGVVIAIELGSTDASPGAPRNGPRAWMRWWPLATALLVFAVAKLVYYGSILPNTFYAKFGGGLPAWRAGIAYNLQFFWSLGSVNLALLAVAIGGHRFTRPAAAKAVMATCALYAVHVAGVGGDYQGFWRYLVPLVPLLVALAVCGLLPLWDDVRVLRGRRRTAVAAAVLMAAALALFLPSWDEVQGRTFLLTRPWRLVEPLPTPGDPLAARFRDDFVIIGRALRHAIAPDRVLGAIAVGAVGYYSELPILDLLGLNDAEIARLPVDRSALRPWIAGHMKGSARVVLERRPDYLLLSLRADDAPTTPPSESVQRAYPFVAELLRSPGFQNGYTLDTCPLPDGRFMNLYRRRDAPPPACPDFTAGARSGGS